MPDLGRDKEDHARTGSGSAPDGRLSRRRVMTASAVAAGVGLAAAPAAAAAGTGGQAVSLGDPGATTVEFRGPDHPVRYHRPELHQLWLPDPGQPRRRERPVQRQAPQRCDGAADRVRHGGPARPHRRHAGAFPRHRRHDDRLPAPQPGANFSDPSSFRVGTPVARYDMTLQDVLTVFATDTGLPTLTGDMLQTAARALSGPLAGQTFGRRGTRLRFFATGLGTQDQCGAQGAAGDRRQLVHRVAAGP